MAEWFLRAGVVAALVAALAWMLREIRLFVVAADAERRQSLDDERRAIEAAWAELRRYYPRAVAPRISHPTGWHDLEEDVLISADGRRTVRRGSAPEVAS